MIILFLGAKAPLELAHVKKNKDKNGTENFEIAITCSLVFLGVVGVY